MPTQTVTAPTIPAGTAVRAYLYDDIDWERRQGRVPIEPDAVASGTLDSAHQIDITADAGNYGLLAVVNEVQTVTVDATGGTYTLTYDAEASGNLDFDFTDAELEAALEAVTTIGAGNVSVSGGPGDSGGNTPYTVTFQGDFAGQNVSALVADSTNLTGGASTATVDTATQGAPSTTGSHLWVLFTIHES